METYLYRNKLTKAIMFVMLLLLTSCLEDPIKTQIEDNFLSSIVVLDNNYFTCSSEGNIYKSENAVDWQLIPTTNTNLLLSLDSKQEIGICSGENGTVLVSTNSGDIWSAKATGVSSFLKNIRIINDSIFIASGESGTVIISTDTGESWGRIETEFTSTVNDMNFYNGVVYFGLRSSTEPNELLYKFDVLTDSLEVIDLEFDELITDISIINDEIYVSDFSGCYKLINQNDIYSKELIYETLGDFFIIEDVVEMNGELNLIGNLGFNLGKLIIDAEGSKTEVVFEESVYFSSAISHDNKIVACGGDELEILIYDDSNSEIVKIK
jgi:hypothetical protein